MDKVALENIEKYVRISHKTAVDWASFCREVCYDAAIERCTKIGGVDENGEPRVVEIDESKFGKRKYHKGRRVEGQWVSLEFFKNSFKTFFQKSTIFCKFF
jgi:hypothetical protein